MEPHVIMLLRERRPEGVNSEHVKAAREHAVECYPNEAVGIVTPDGYVRLDNISSEPGFNFAVDASVVIEHPVILALIHSHPDGDVAPTQTDMQSQIAMDVPWGILSVGAGGDCTDEPVWFGDQCPVPPLVGRMFLHGITDCYSLIRDYYRTERGVLLPDFPRDDVWWEAGQNLYEENFQRAGFKKIAATDEDLQPGDGFLCRFRSPVVNHAGIYAGDGLILHHLAGHVSGHSPLNVWRRTIDYWVRYEG
jgi:cell wall-associated NlpC family hydrolase